MKREKEVLMKTSQKQFRGKPKIQAGSAAVLAKRNKTERRAQSKG